MHFIGSFDTYTLLLASFFYYFSVHKKLAIERSYLSQCNSYQNELHKQYSNLFTFCRREQAIRKVLVRYSILDADDADYNEKETFLLNNLGVPVVWIHEAKVIYFEGHVIYF